MRRQPEKLEIPAGDPVAIIGAFIRTLAPLLTMCCISIINGFGLASHRDPDLVRASLACAGIVLTFLIVAYIWEAITTFYYKKAYVTIDKSGLACSLPTRQSHTWSNVAACACKNDHGRTILRVFSRGRAERTVDIDFALAAQPKQSLEKATAACAEWIVATRDPRETEPPVREFVEKRESRGGPSRIALYSSAAVFCVFALIVIVAVHRLF